MLRVSKLADYAVIVMAEMAKQSQASCSGQQLAELTQIALPTVRKILKLLLQSGLLMSTRGIKGGYALARTADNISIMDVITAIDGPLAITECCHTDKQCQRDACCPSRSNWHVINQAIRQILHSISVAQMNGQLTTLTTGLPWQIQVVNQQEQGVC